MNRILSLALMGAVLSAAACVPRMLDESGGPQPAERNARDLPPAGFGSLRQEDISVSLRQNALLIRITPLSEAVIRLAAPDTYDRLHAVAERWREEAVRASLLAEPELFLVSFFSYEPQVTFEPQDLQIEQQGRLFRPAGIVPISPGWGRQRLQQQESQSAIFAFRPEIDLDTGLTVRYGMEFSDRWNRVLPTLELERGKVRSQAGAPPTP